MSLSRENLEREAWYTIKPSVMHTIQLLYQGISYFSKTITAVTFCDLLTPRTGEQIFPSKSLLPAGPPLTSCWVRTPKLLHSMAPSILIFTTLRWSNLTIDGCPHTHHGKHLYSRQYKYPCEVLQTQQDGPAVIPRLFVSSAVNTVLKLRSASSFFHVWATSKDAEIRRNWWDRFHLRVNCCPNYCIVNS